MQRRRWITAAVAVGILATGCTSGNGPDDPSATETAAGSSLPPADTVVADLVAGLNAFDVTTLPVTDPTAAQAELETVFVGMDGITPTVTAGSIEYSDSDETARAKLTFEYPVGVDGWTYESVAPLELAAKEWKIEWTPTIIHPQLTSDSRMRHLRKLPKRAAINDNAGLALVEERTLFQVGIDKSQVPEAEWAAAAAQLASLLEVDPVQFQAKVAAGGPKQFVVARTMTQEEITPDVGKVNGAQVLPTTAMVPVSDTFAASLLGTVGTPTPEMLADPKADAFASETVGLSGLQSRYEKRLRGAPEVRIDLVGRTTDADATFEEQNLFLQDASIGSPLQLSLDRELQTKAETVLSTQPGLAALVVIRNGDGALLAAANSPTAGTFPQATYGKFAPGSTFKVVSSLAMLRSGLTPGSTVQCPNSLVVGAKTFGNYSDYPSSKIGAITLTEAVANSCNTVFAGAAATITPEQLHDAAGSLGVGTDYDAGFTSNFGTVQPNNSPIDRAASMIGQGQITMSPMGMAAVAASVASGKTTIPWLVDGTQVTPTAPPLTAEEATQLQALMTAVVTDGSGRSLAGLMTGAKTGTAEYGTVGAYKTHGWMIAWNEGVSVAAFVEDGVSGSQSAAPLITALFS
ncbi:MAG: penicillin-binding transpeptidase domain-containing protein [Propionibacteriaceae bacterium]|nr:penicillin-binding transpeptidase domain-containing protein [Propionibacteriaceae bacterium]